MRLQGKVAIVTGARTGIGLATAVRFGKEGAKIVFVDINDATEIVADLRSVGVEAIFEKVDVTNASQVSSLVERITAIYGRLDILVNNAAVELGKNIVDTSEAEWENLMNVNLKGVFLCCKAAIPVMRSNRSGVIVNVASELGLVGGSDIAAYSASKGGVVQLTKSMAIDHAADGIRVNCVAPGPIATSLLESIINQSLDPDKERRSIVEKTLLKRLGTPDEIANVITFIVSDEASYMTGSIIVVDGGWTAQ